MYLVTQTILEFIARTKCKQPKRHQSFDGQNVEDSHQVTNQEPVSCELNETRRNRTVQVPKETWTLDRVLPVSEIPLYVLLINIIFFFLLC